MSIQPTRVQSKKARLCMSIALAAASFAAFLLAPRPAAAQPCTTSTVALANGAQLCGSTQTVSYNGKSVSVNVYKGIPYAIPPTGANNLRWQPPQPAPAWHGILQATRFAPICPQGTNQTGAPQSEDCLYLNVWSPADATAGNKRPVMVFIHGGAFIEGAGSAAGYDGSYLAASGDVVVVTLNYRLGALGFQYANHSPSILAPGPAIAMGGNFGLLDQQLALNWVQNNIANLGGDNQQVTLFGESAGAMSVGFHLFSIKTNQTTQAPAAGLFQAAIMESNPMGVLYRDATVPVIGGNAAQRDGYTFLNNICQVLGKSKGCWPDANNNQKGWIQGLTTDQIMAAQKIFASGLGPIERILGGGLVQALPWVPVIDGSFVVSQPYQGYATGMTAKPFIFGVNRNEGQTFAGMAYAGVIASQSNDLTPASYGLLVGRIFLTGAGKIGTIDNYNASYYVANPSQIPKYLNPSGNTATAGGTATALGNLINDFAFRCGNLFTASRVKQQQPAIFGYFFQAPPIFDLYGTLPACAPEAGNVCHANELPYVFNTLATQYVSLQSTDTALAQSMAQAWTTFAKNIGKNTDVSTAVAPYSGWTAYNATSGGGQLAVWSAPASSISLYGTLDQDSNCSSLWFTEPPFKSPGGK